MGATLLSVSLVYLPMQTTWCYWRLVQMPQETCLKYAMNLVNDIRLSSNAIKSKCLLCLSSNRSCRMPHAPTPVFYIGGNVVEFVNEWSHLGHVISTSGADMYYIESRKFSLIGQINGILCDFRNVTCNFKIRLVKTYCTSLYGAELWDLSSDHIDSMLHRLATRHQAGVAFAKHNSLVAPVWNL